MKRFWKTAALLTVAAVLTAAVMSGCKQGTDGTSNTGGTGSAGGSGGTIPGSVLPPVTADAIRGLWKMTQGGPRAPDVLYLYYEGSGEIVYAAITGDNGNTFKKLRGTELKFKDGKIVMEAGGRQTKLAVKKEGNTLKLFEMIGGTAASMPDSILEKDADPAHSGWGAKIKAATP